MHTTNNPYPDETRMPNADSNHTILHFPQEDAADDADDSDDTRPHPSIWRVVGLLLLLVIIAALVVFVVLPAVDMWLNPPRDLPPLAPPIQT